MSIILNQNNIKDLFNNSDVQLKNVKDEIETKIMMIPKKI